MANVQDLSDEELMGLIKTQPQGKSVSDLSDEELMQHLQKTQEASQNTKQVQTPKPMPTPAQKAIEQRTNGLIGRATINALPFIGGVGGALAGSGIASIPTAGLGAAAGEGLKQRILEQQEGASFNPQQVEQAGISGAVGQGLGLGVGSVFERLMPYVGKALPKIDPETYRYATSVYKKGGAESKNNWLLDETFNHARPLGKSMSVDPWSGALGTEAIAELLLHAHPGVGAGAYISKRLLESPIAHKQLLKAYGQSTRLPLGGGVGVYLNERK